MTPDDLQRTYDGRKYKSPANDTEIMSVVPLLIRLWERASTAVNQMICTCAFITRCEKCELHEVLEKLRETK